MVMPLIVLSGMAFIPDAIYRLRNPVHGLSEPTRAKVTAAIAEARSTADHEEELLQEGVSATLRADVEARPEIGRCPYRHTPSTPPSTRAEGMYTPSFARSDAPKRCLTCQSLLGQAEVLDRALTERTREKDLDARVEKQIAGLRPLAPYTVVVDVISERAATGTPHQGFVPGFVRGRVLVWDTRAHRVACISSFVAESSEGVDVTYTTRGGIEVGGHAELTSALQADLRYRTESAIAQSLR